MSCNSKKYNRRSIRLRSYDYSQPGAYFVTICTQDRLLLFQDENVSQMIEKWWRCLDDKFENVDTDEFIVMPNHTHGIIFINVGAHPCVRPNFNYVENGPTHRSAPTHGDSDVGLYRVSLGHIIQWFKTMTTNEYIRRVKSDYWHSFPKQLWQRNYWEHVIRNERALDAVRRYIAENPLRWDFDRYNAKATGKDQFAKELWRMLNTSTRQSSN